MENSKILVTLDQMESARCNYYAISARAAAACVINRSVAGWWSMAVQLTPNLKAAIGAAGLVSALAEEHRGCRWTRRTQPPAFRPRYVRKTSTWSSIASGNSTFDEGGRERYSALWQLL